MPTNIMLQRFSFADGRKLSLSGTAPADQVNTLFEFNSTMKKVKIDDRQVFDPNQGEDVNPRITANKATWSFSLQLQHTEKLP
jgi:hypothetical protein